MPTEKTANDPVKVKKAFKKALGSHAVWLTRSTGWAFEVKDYESAGHEDLDNIDTLGAMAIFRGTSPDDTQAVEVEMDLGFLDIDEGYLTTSYYNPYSTERKQVEMWGEPRHLIDVLRTPKKLWGWVERDLSKGRRACEPLIRLAHNNPEIRDAVLTRMSNLAGTFADYLYKGEDLFLKASAKGINSLARDKGEAKVLRERGQPPYLVYDGADMNDHAFQVTMQLVVVSSSKVLLHFYGEGAYSGRFDGKDQFTWGNLKPSTLVDLWKTRVGVF